ncbi:MAG: Maf family protein [Clostridia bacterium]|nr:Maf family protein [Clostridia bacterium]
MRTIRKKGGLSGFTRIEESEYDANCAGHASDSISIALGMARARKLKNEDYHVVCVVGDGALTGGMCYEALNDAGHTKTPMIIVLNDNAMSISSNVGAMSKHLTNMRQSNAYRQIKQKIRRMLERIPRMGKPAVRVLSKIRDVFKSLLINDLFFDALGIEYLGPVDGHDIAEMERVFARAKLYDEPVLIHVVTQKGRGYSYAEVEPEQYHGVQPFDMKSGEAKKTSGIRSLEKEVSFTVATDVRFGNLTPDEISYYIDTCKPFDKAGAYGVQEWIGYAAIKGIEGSYFNVVGLPVHRLYNELKSF